MTHDVIPAPGRFQRAILLPSKRLPGQHETIFIPDRLIGMSKVTDRTDLCRSKIYGLIRSGDFPAPIKIGRSSRWRESEIAAWIEQQSSEQPSPVPQAEKQPPAAPVMHRIKSPGGNEKCPCWDD